VFKLVDLVPGSFTSGNAVSIGGRRMQSGLYMVDGVNATIGGLGATTIELSPPVESIQEFKVHFVPERSLALPVAASHNWAEALFVSAGSARGYFDFDLHAGVGQAGGNHGRGGSHFFEVLAEDWPAWCKIFDAREDVAHANYTCQAASGFQ
jgi:hypothetical protein